MERKNPSNKFDPNTLGFQRRFNRPIDSRTLSEKLEYKLKQLRRNYFLQQLKFDPKKSDVTPPEDNNLGLH
jgi:hypothetical protein